MWISLRDHRWIGQGVYDRAQLLYLHALGSHHTLAGHLDPFELLVWCYNAGFIEGFSVTYACTAAVGENDIRR